MFLIVATTVEDWRIEVGMLVSGLVVWLAGIGWRNRHRMRVVASHLRPSRPNLPPARVVRGG